MSKGSRPRPYSVSLDQYSANYDAIFGKKDRRAEEEAELEDEVWNDLYKRQTMTPRTEQVQEGGTSCGCGRSPTGKCIGWHALSEQEFQKRLAEHQEKNK